MRFPLVLGALLLSLPLAAQTPATVPPGAVYTYVEQMPVPPGGIDITLQYIQNHLRYPAEALRQGVEGKVFVQVVVDMEGRVREPKITKGLGAGCDEEALRIIGQMPPWTPGKQNGQVVSVYYTLPVVFRLPDAPAPPVGAGEPAPPLAPVAKVYTEVEQMPVPQGGMQALPAYLSANLQYPAEARKQRVAGTVQVRVVVDSEGRLTQPTVIKSVHPLLDAEALRVIGQMPAWTPGRQNGRAVHVLLTVPVTFRL